MKFDTDNLKVYNFLSAERNLHNQRRQHTSVYKSIYENPLKISVESEDELFESYRKNPIVKSKASIDNLLERIIPVGSENYIPQTKK